MSQERTTIDGTVWKVNLSPDSNSGRKELQIISESSETTADAVNSDIFACHTVSVCIIYVA